MSQPVHRAVHTVATDLAALQTDLHALADRCDDDDIVVVTPPGGRVVASASELAAQLDWFDAEVVMAPGEALACFGRLSAVRRLLDGKPAAAEVDDGTAFVAVRDPYDDIVQIGGLFVSADSGIPVIVALADPSKPPPAPPPSVDPGQYARVLALAGAADRLDSANMVANEIVTLSYWTPRYCSDLIEVAEGFDRWGRDSDDPVPGDEVSLLTLSPRLFAHVESDLASRVVPRLRMFWPEFAWCGLHDAFVIRFTTSGAGPDALRLHHDVAQISGTVRLNTDYAGGATEFPRQGYDTAAAAVGSLTMWPSLVTHPHRTLPVTRGTKYGLTLWLRLPD